MCLFLSGSHRVTSARDSSVIWNRNRSSSSSFASEALSSTRGFSHGWAEDRHFRNFVPAFAPSPWTRHSRIPFLFLFLFPTPKAAPHASPCCRPAVNASAYHPIPHEPGTLCPIIRPSHPTDEHGLLPSPRLGTTSSRLTIPFHLDLLTSADSHIPLKAYGKVILYVCVCCVHLLLCMIPHIYEL